MKKGYKAEWEVKKVLSKKYSPDSIFKVAIGGTVDFCVLGKGGKIKKFIEVKKTNKNRWYPGRHDLLQFQKLLKIHQKYKIPVEYWIKINRKWKIFDIKKVKEFFKKNEKN
jgi:Holliday junction resolvase-like predicted endonuclease